jgi:hypothetical protein
MCTSKIDMVESVESADIDTFVDNAAWAICSMYHLVLKASPGAAIFGQDMLFEHPFLADCKQIGYYEQCQIDHSNASENTKYVIFDYKVGDKVLIKLNLSSTKQSSYEKKQPYTITTVHTNGTIRIQCKTELERINVQRITP